MCGFRPPGKESCIFREVDAEFWLRHFIANGLSGSDSGDCGKPCPSLSMPVDLSMLMGASPPASAFMPLSNYQQLQSFDPDLSSLGPCRRTSSSYPSSSSNGSSPQAMVGNHSAPSVLTSTSKAVVPIKSYSEISLLSIRSQPISVPIPSSLNSPLFEVDAMPSVSASAPSRAVFTLADLERELAIIHASNQADEGTGTGQEELGEDGEGAGHSPPSSPVPKGKKKVSFADQTPGGQLFTIRVMREPSDVPPKLDSSLLRSLLGQTADEEARPSATWFLSFPQPASQYLPFRRALEDQKVALENVILRNEECSLLGTIKVRNLCFDKTVLLRCTDDGWKSHTDHAAQYSPGPCSSNAAASRDDTFSFKIQIPCDDEKRRRIEFAVCFRAEDGTEYWDSNKGANYALLSQKAKLASPTGSFSGRNANKMVAPDPYKLDHENWTQFAIWRDLPDSCPYY